MIIANGKNITPDVVFCQYNSQTKKYDIKFKSGKIYSYSYNNVTWMREPKSLDPSGLRIMYDAKELFGISEIFVFGEGNNKYWHICFGNGSERDYEESTLKIISSCFNTPTSKDVFNYLKQTADLVSLRADDGTRLLSKQYEKIDFVGEDKAFSAYVNPKRYPIKKLGTFVPIFPFGCNASQFKAVKNALENQLSVIQGPPGTGKTQTILNIIANLLIAGKTVQVVSNNNSATANVFDKLSSSQYNMGFLVATLGNSENKARFIREQENEYPGKIQKWASDISGKSDFFKEVSRRSEALHEIFNKQEKLALASQNFLELETEFKYFKQYLDETGRGSLDHKIRRQLQSEKFLQLWKECKYISDSGKTPSFFFKLKFRFVYGIAEWSFYNKDMTEIITLMQSLFYSTKRTELNREIDELERVLVNCNQKKLVEEFIEMTMRYLKSILNKRYGKNSARRVFSEEDLWKNPADVQKEYPVILSTTFSARSSLCKDAEFDYLIMDEASQVDVATGALALSCAKNAVIVGDTKQLPNVVTEDNRVRLQSIFDSYNISSNYNFAEKSFLQSVCDVITNVPKTLLREHYRCHPKIINFCNQKFYDGNLVIMSKDSGEADVISVIKTVAGDHKRDRMNQRQIDVVKQELLPSITYSDEEIGIIAPYNNQVQAIHQALSDTQIDIATVHKFQGREKDAIIITTVDNEVTDFSDDPYLLNVAITRAKKSLCIIVSGNEQPKDSNIGDLIDYIEYNNFTVAESAIYSVFDLLYRQYTESRIQYLKPHGEVSRFDSENLVYALIKNVLQENNYSTLDVVCHQPLNMLIRDSSLLNEEECRYAMHSSTHLDFLIYNRISKKPVLSIEVDGFHYHKKGTAQAERDRKKNHILELYGISLLRFATNASGEKEKLTAKLREVLN